MLPDTSTYSACLWIKNILIHASEKQEVAVAGLLFCTDRATSVVRAIEYGWWLCKVLPVRLLPGPDFASVLAPGLALLKAVSCADESPIIDTGVGQTVAGEAVTFPRRKVRAPQGGMPGNAWGM
jgi:hypothetical protein